MSFSLQIILMSNLVVMVICLSGFLFFKLDENRKTVSRLRKRILYLSDLLTEKNEPSTSTFGGSNKRQAQHNQLNDVMEHQMNVLSTVLDLEDFVEHVDGREIDQVKLQLTILKAQSENAHQLIEHLKTDSRSSYYRQNVLEMKLQDTKTNLERAVFANHEIGGKYERLAGNYKETIKRIKELLSSKEKLTQSIATNIRLENEVTEYSRVHDIQIREIEELKVANQTQSKNLEEDSELMKVGAKFEELENDLARTLKEKDFLETQFLEVVNSLESKDLVEEELFRAKKEFSLLEDRYIELNDET